LSYALFDHPAYEIAGGDVERIMLTHSPHSNIIAVLLVEITIVSYSPLPNKASSSLYVI
jgi:hypothetical protein